MDGGQILRIWRDYISGWAIADIARRERVSRRHIHMAIDAFLRARRIGN